MIMHKISLQSTTQSLLHNSAKQRVFCKLKRNAFFFNFEIDKLLTADFVLNILEEMYHFRGGGKKKMIYTTTQ